LFTKECTILLLAYFTFTLIATLVLDVTVR